MMSLFAMLVMASLPVRIEVTEATVKDLPRHQVALMHHDQTMMCEGPLLADILIRSGLPAGKAVRGSALRQAVMARAKDGYAVLFSLGEIDGQLGKARIIVADSCDDKPLGPDDGPFRLAVADDARGARSVRQLIALEIASID